MRYQPDPDGIYRDTIPVLPELMSIRHRLGYHPWFPCLVQYPFKSARLASGKNDSLCFLGSSPFRLIVNATSTTGGLQKKKGS